VELNEQDKNLNLDVMRQMGINSSCT